MKYALGLMIAVCLAPHTVNGHAGATPPATPASVTAPAAVTAVGPLEVRLRKLHLVRPDLQRFPIPYDTVC